MNIQSNEYGILESILNTYVFKQIQSESSKFSLPPGVVMKTLSDYSYSSKFIANSQTHYGSFFSLGTRNIFMNTI